ncbi:unnamed protein product [Brassica rapa subsp. trilocularis]
MTKKLQKAMANKMKKREIKHEIQLGGGLEFLVLDE